MIPFIGPSYSLNTRKADVQRSVNCYPVANEVAGGKTGGYLQSVAGLDLFSDTIVQPTGCDPEFANVIWLVAGDVDADAGLHYPDLSVHDIPFGVGSSTLSTDFSKFSTASIHTVNSSFGPTANALYPPGTSDFSYEFWMLLTVPSIASVSTHGVSGLDASLGASGSDMSGGSNNPTVGTWNVITNTTNPGGPIRADYPGSGWHFYEITRHAGVLYFFIDGHLKGTTTSNDGVAGVNGNLTSTKYIFAAGADGTTGTLDQYFNEIRYTKGSYRNIVPYSPPRAPFPRIACV